MKLFPYILLYRKRIKVLLTLVLLIGSCRRWRYRLAELRLGFGTIEPVPIAPFGASATNGAINYLNGTLSVTTATLPSIVEGVINEPNTSGRLPADAVTDCQFHTSTDKSACRDLMYADAALFQSMRIDPNDPDRWWDGIVQ